MQLYEVNICQIAIFRFYAVYNKNDADQNRQLYQRKMESIIGNTRIILLQIIGVVSLVEKHTYKKRAEREY